MKKLSLGMKKTLIPNVNRSMAARMRGPHGKGLPKIRINKGLAPNMKIKGLK